MSYLNNNTVTVDAILTKRGRELFSQGNFNITKFALADDEVDYALYDASHPSGSDFYDVAIRNLPMLEAIPDGSKMMRFKLITLPKGTSQIPLISIGLNEVHLRAVFSSYPGQSQIITPSTVNGLNSTLGYTATIASSQYVTIRANESVNRKQIPNVNTTGNINRLNGNDEVIPINRKIIDGGSAVPGRSVVGYSFLLTAKTVPDNSVYSTTLRITGNETGGEVVVNIFISRQTKGGEQTQSIAQ